MQAIAKASGVTKATLYHHFRNKEDLFFEVMQMRFRRAQDAMVRELAAGRTLRERLVRFTEHMFSAERADLSRLLGDFHRYVDRRRQVTFWTTFPRPWHYLEAMLREAVANGEIHPCDPDLVARVWFSAIAGQLQIPRYASDIPAPDARLAERVADILLDGLAPRG
jgi:AcrR family transcriptional regulator